MTEARCPALFISAPASGQGKTTVTAGLARLYRSKGYRVRVFKAGPDFLDPQILEGASGHPVYQLDLWMGGKPHCRALLYRAAQEADLVLIEGVMGLFDGIPSSADLAQLFGIPVLAVIDASAMAETFAAIAQGLARFRADLPFAGVLVNRAGSKGHVAMLAESLPDDIRFIGALLRDKAIALPSRHLGLAQADELDDLDDRLDGIAEALAPYVRTLPEAVTFLPPGLSVPTARTLDGRRIAVARDAAFSFLYQANLDVLHALGAEVRFFSPLTNDALPEADAVYLPGGYPELHLDRLSGNAPMHAALRAHAASGKPIVAECGGLLFLLEGLTHTDGHSAPMAGLLPGAAAMRERLVNLGLHSVILPEGEFRGHTFHYSEAEIGVPALTHTKAARHHGRPESVYRKGRITASYMHFYFPSNPEAAARLFLP